MVTSVELEDGNGLPPVKLLVCPCMVGPTNELTEKVCFVVSYANTTLGSGDFVGIVTTEHPLNGSYVLPCNMQLINPVLLDPECPG